MPAMMLPYCAFFPVSRLVSACSTVTGACIIVARWCRSPCLGSYAASHWHGAGRPIEATGRGN